MRLSRPLGTYDVEPGRSERVLRRGGMSNASRVRQLSLCVKPFSAAYQLQNLYSRGVE